MQVHKGQDISENIIKSLIEVLDGIPDLSNAIAYYKHTEYIDINDDEKRFVELFLITPNYGVIVFRSFSVIENDDEIINDCFFAFKKCLDK